MVMAADAQRPITMAVRGPIGRDDLPGLSERVCGLLGRHPGRIVHCDVVDVPADAVTVEALARLQLVARRNACRIVLCNASPELRDLVQLMGLADVLLTAP